MYVRTDAGNFTASIWRECVRIVSAEYHVLKLLVTCWSMCLVIFVTPSSLLCNVPSAEYLRFRTLVYVFFRAKTSPHDVFLTSLQTLERRSVKSQSESCFEAKFLFNSFQLSRCIKSFLWLKNVSCHVTRYSLYYRSIFCCFIHTNMTILI